MVFKNFKLFNKIGIEIIDFMDYNGEYKWFGELVKNSFDMFGC